jgi:hypothetical protein
MRLLFICFLLYFIPVYSQDCESLLKTDSLELTNPLEKKEVKHISINIKNNYTVSFINLNNKFYLKITVTDNLGFGKKGILEISSGKKQYYEKDIVLKSKNNQTGYFIFEINQNYTKTISEYGMTGIIFNSNSSFAIPKNDSEELKKAATCFYKLFPQQY